MLLKTEREREREYPETGAVPIPGRGPCDTTVHLVHMSLCVFVIYYFSNLKKLIKK